MMVKRLVLGLCFVVLGVGVCGSTWAHVDVEKARALVGEYESAVVTMSLVIEVSSSYEGQTNKRESKSNAVATIIDPSGLAVTSLSSIDPTVLQERFMSSDEMKMTSTIKDAKIRQPQGTDIPVDVVLRDKDWDLAFVKPKKVVDQPFKFVDMKTAAAAKILDPLICFSRLGQVAGFSTYAALDSVLAVIAKPRNYYVVQGQCGMGCPAFNADGRPVGIVVLRTQASGGRDMDFMSMSGPMGGMLPIVLPCEYIANSAEQAKAAKAPAPTPAPAPAPKPAAKP